MEAILELQNALIKNYYKDFICSIDDEEIEFNHYSELIIYRNNEYIEKRLEVIKDEIRFIIEDIKPLYLKALSETLFKLANLPAPTEKLNLLYYTIKILSIPLVQLRKDFYINDCDSRYFSIPYPKENTLSVEEITSQIIDKFFNDKEYKNLYSNPSTEFDDMDVWELAYFNIRLKIISKLPFSLFTITSSLINILNHKIDEINEEIEAEKSDLLKLKWIGKPSQFGHIIGQLAHLGYIEPPKRDNGEINYTQFSKDLLRMFKTETTQGTLAAYLNPNNEKAQETERNFKKANFNIPHKKEVS
ncbi:hypothetical protein [Lutibacter sp. B1]|uniref:hypothetical protein n=1 Tax=Lutibacter sp. B1 TaxID=2725996 RepID=UPI0014573AB4|nr:hypothetical protein [Lutibacter sp. B1]NLP59231.1 hypothetical protein [Lutibacter sp. B1]